MRLRWKHGDRGPWYRIDDSDLWRADAELEIVQGQVVNLATQTTLDTWDREMSLSQLEKDCDLTLRKQSIYLSEEEGHELVDALDRLPDPPAEGS